MCLGGYGVYYAMIGIWKELQRMGLKGWFSLWHSKEHSGFYEGFWVVTRGVDLVESQSLIP